MSDVFGLSPISERRLRTAKPACAGVVNFRCKCCKRSIYTMQGRKRVHQGWICSECAK